MVFFFKKKNRAGGDVASGAIDETAKAVTPLLPHIVDVPVPEVVETALDVAGIDYSFSVA